MENLFIRIDVWAASSRMPAELDLMLESGERGKIETRQRHLTITKTRQGFEVKNNSSPEQTGVAGNFALSSAGKLG